MTHEAKHIFITAAAVALVLSAAAAPAAAADVAAGRPATQPGAALPPKTVKAVKTLLAKAELVVLGKVAAVYDRTARDAGMRYDVAVDKMLKGKWQKKSLSFRSSGQIGYAKYTKGQRVLLFLRRWGDRQPKLLQLKPVVYISPPQAGALDLRPVEKYLKLIESLQPGGDKPAMRAGERAKLLKQHVGKFSLTLKHINPHGPNIRPVVRLTVAEMGGRVRTWRISKAQALKLIDHLAAEGFLASSRDIFVTKAPEITGPCCVLSVGGLPGVSLEQNLGWDLKMLGRLDALRKILDGKAGKAMAEFIKALEPQRKIWRQIAASFVKRMKASKRALNLVLTYHPVGLRDRNAHHNLHLYWTVFAQARLPASIIVMSRPEALAAIDALDKTGYFELADDVTARRAMRTLTPWPEHKGPCYSLTVSSDNLDCHANLGWDLKMIEYLDAMRKALDKGSDAGKAVDKVLKALAPQRKKWQAQAPRYDKPRRACLAALREIRKDFAALAVKYPKELGHLGPPAIDEKKLLLHFPIKGLAKTTQPARRTASAGQMRSMLKRRLRPDELGLFVQFTVPMPKRPRVQWLYSNVGFSWWWMWPNRSFSSKAQQDLLNMLTKALEPLNELENAMVAADLARRKTGAFVLRGRPGVKLSLRLAPKRAADGSAIIELYATNETKKVLALCPPFPQILGDGKPWHYRPSDPLPMMIRAFDGGKDPFFYIKPGQRAKVGAAVAAGLSPGRHTVRVAVCHACDTWIDQRPVAYDGPPITRKIPGTWTGVLVSGELAIDIPTPAAANKKAAERAKLLKKKTGTPYLALLYHGDSIGAKPSLYLATTNYSIDVVGGIQANPTPKEVANIIDHLAKEGFLAQAENVAGKDITPPRGPAYTLTLMGAGQTRLYQVLGWDLKMLRRLEGLRKVLAKDSDASKAMDKLLKALEPQRKIWRKEAAATQPGRGKQFTKAAERAKLLKKGADSFRLTLQWHTTQGKSLSPGQSLQLTTVGGDYKPRPFFATVVITKQRAGKIIEHLAAEGFLDRASDVKDAKSYPVPKLKSYSLTVRTTFGPHLYEHMPWGLNLLKRVEGLRKVMTGNRNAIRVLDQILVPLEAQRGNWKTGKPENQGQSRMALPSEALCISIVSFCTHRRKAHRMADALVHGDAGNTVILCDIRNRKDKPC